MFVGQSLGLLDTIKRDESDIILSSEHYQGVTITVIYSVYSNNLDMDRYSFIYW